MIIGNVGKDANVTITNGKKAVNFNVGVNRSWKDKDGNKCTSTNWYSCTRWMLESESSEIAKYLLKGTKVFVEGSLQPDMYKTKENSTAIDLKLNVKVIELLDSKKSDTTNTTETTTSDASTTSEEFPA